MKMVTRYISIGIMVLLVAALSTSTVLADPGHGNHGKGNGNKGGNDSGSGSLTVTGSLSSSNPYLAWGAEVYTVHGTGLGANEAVYISLASPGCCSGSKVWTDRNGEFSFAKATGAPGTYTATALQSSGNGKFKQVGKVSFLEIISSTLSLIGVSIAVWDIQYGNAVGSPRWQRQWKWQWEWEWEWE